MYPLAYFIDFLQGMIDDENSDLEIQMRKWVNLSIAECSKRHRWSSLKSEVTLSPTEDGVILVPPLCDYIRRIYSDDRASLFHLRETDRSNAQARMAQLWYTGYAAPTTGEVVVATCSVSEGEQTVTSTGTEFLEAHEGSLLLFDSEEQPYEIVSFTSSSEVEIYPTYRGESNTTHSCVVNPLGQSRLALYNGLSADDAVYTDDVIVEYQMRHPLLYSDTDRLLIPCPNTVILRSLKWAMRKNKYDVDAERLDRDILQSMNLEIRNDKGPPEQILPKGLGGGPTMFAVETRRGSGTGMFKTR